MADDQDRIKARAEALLPEEEEAGSDDPVAQAAAILEESDERNLILAGNSQRLYGFGS